ncbi:SpoIIE family protein phosphatase [Streptacidiphilus sp. N1-3]|uniref:SpoIIE family protein phosphatase n=1 Tax=Streptacidiphilus alkalitolerans TaxID=3342712 RepID=A0ABV6XBU7_9ACTN
MERFAGLVARIVSVPVALVSLVEADRQVFPGMVGLAAEPWATRRWTPLSHSLCQHVALSGSPLVLDDAREDALTCASMAIPDLGVVAYAGMPLTDADGTVLGSLCAIDTVTRAWTPRELENLRDLAAACSAELRLRIASHHARAAQAGAELLLRAAEELTGTAGLAQVRERVRDLVSGDIKPSYVGLQLLEGRYLRRLPDPVRPLRIDARYEYTGVNADFATAVALRERRMVTIRDRADAVARYAPEAVAAWDSLGIASAVCLPLTAARGPVGVLVLGWDATHPVGVNEAAVLTSIAGYTAQAVERAVFLDQRIEVAHQLQNAMLTDLPTVPGLDLAALYRPASTDDKVGGDWYDAFPLEQPGSTSCAGAGLALTVGDITGHDIHAATLMGQVRSMLRQAALIKNSEGPTAALLALEHACRTLPLEASGTLVHAHLHPGGNGGWNMSWTNAGHPPPLLLTPDGTVHRLNDHGVLLYHGLHDTNRTDHHLHLPVGSTLLLYTDGLVERRGHDLNLAITRTGDLLAEAGRHTPLPDLLEHLADQVPGHPADDDIVLLALRIPHPGDPVRPGRGEGPMAG